MMKQTATVQVNIDFDSERDAMAKLRTGMGLVPLLTAMFANSPLSDGALNGMRTFRGHIWTDTDPARCGLLPFVYRADCGFSDYVDYALDVPMYFVVRDGQWIDMTVLTADSGPTDRGAQATLPDWNATTTLFPEFRLALHQRARSMARHRSSRWRLDVRAFLRRRLPAGGVGSREALDGMSVALYHAVHREALRARVRGVAVHELARELVDIAETGLTRQDQRNAAGDTEACYLERLRDQVRRGRCPADAIVERWNGPWQQDVRRLVEGTAYRLPQ
jgi:glutamate--cysteine ligase